MNNARRKELERAMKLANEVGAMLEEIKSIIETARDEETDYRDNMPESLQNGEKGERANAAIDALDSAYSAVESFDVSELDEYISEAIN